MAQEVRLADRLEQLDREVRTWARLTRKRLLFRIASLNLEERIRLNGETSLRKDIRTSVRKKSGDIEKVSFIFPRQGIFLEHGVGKGRPVRSAQANRFKKPWISEEIPDAIEDLAEILAEQYADVAASELVFRIPGIIDTKVTG